MELPLWASLQLKSIRWCSPGPILADPVGQESLRDSHVGLGWVVVTWTPVWQLRHLG